MNQWPSEPAEAQDRHGQGLPCAFCAGRSLSYQPDEERHAIVDGLAVCRSRCLPVLETILAARK